MQVITSSGVISTSVTGGCGDEMLVVGCFLAFVASGVRTWGALNHQRSPTERAPIFWSVFFGMLVALGSGALGIVGSVLIGISTSAVIGLVASVVFWFSPRLLAPILEALGF